MRNYNIGLKYLKIIGYNFSRQSKIDDALIPLVILLLIAFLNIKNQFLYIGLISFFSINYIKNKKDKYLLLHYFRKKEVIFLYMLECLFINLLWLPLSIFNDNIEAVTIGFGFTFSIALFTYHLVSNERRKIVFFETKLIHPKLYELKSLIRKRPFYTLLILIGFFTAFFDIILSFIFLYFLFEFVVNIHSKNENKEFLEAYFINYSFEEKIRANLYFGVLLLTPLLFQIFLNTEKVMTIIYLCIVFVIFNLLIIFKKYENYDHKTTDNQPHIIEILRLMLLSCTLIGGILYLRSSYPKVINKIKAYVGS